MNIFKLSLPLFIFLFTSISSYSNHNTDSLKTALRNSLPDTSRIKTFIALHQAYRFDSDSSLFFIRQAIALAEKTKNNTFIARSYIALAWYYNSTTKKQDSALYIARNTYDRMQLTNFTEGMARACNLISIVYAETQLDSAIFYSLKTIELHKKNNNIDGVNSTKINLAGMYNNMKKYHEAITLAKEILPYFENTKNYHHAGTVCINLGNYYLSLNDFVNAIVYMQKSFEFNKLRNDPYGEAYALAQIGHIYLKQQKYNEALPFFAQAVSRGKEMNSDEIKFMGYGGLIQIAAANQEWDKVISFDNEELKQAFMHEPDEAKIYELLAMAYEKKADYKKALNNHKQFILINNRTDDLERIQKADELEVIYQNKEKQNKIQLLSKEKQIESAEKQRQILLRNLTIGFGLILIIVSLLLFNRFKLKKKIETQQSLLNERKRISAELHDDLGAQLSTLRMLIGKLKSAGNNNGDSLLVERSIDLLENSIYKLRGMMNELDNSTLEMDGYLRATEELINKISGLQNLMFEFSHTNMDQRLPKITEHHLFRITQELINNTLKYAKAKTIIISIVREKNTITFMYEDDGAGFDPTTVVSGKGLKNVMQRAKLLNGSAETDSAFGKGMRFNLQFNIL